MAGVHAMMISSSGSGYVAVVPVPVPATANDCGNITVNALYLKPNGVTIAAIPNAACGKWHTFMGKDYYIAKDYADLVSVVSVYKGRSGAGEVLANLTRDGKTKTIPLNQVVTTFVDKFSTGSSSGGLFYAATTFNQRIDSWDTSNVTNMSYVFAVCSVFNQDLSGWDTSNVTNMNGMFYYCNVFNQDLSGWCVSKIPSSPSNFAAGASASWTTAKKPKWGAPCS